MKTGSWKCRLLGEPMYYSKQPENAPYKRVLARAGSKWKSDNEKLKAVNSFADLPVGDSSHPKGTFHIMSKDPDLFASEAVTRYLKGIAEAINRVLVRIEYERQANDLKEASLVRTRDKVLNQARYSRLLDLAMLARSISESVGAGESVVELSHLIRKRSLGLSAICRFRQREPLDRNSVEECDISVILADVVSAAMKAISSWPVPVGAKKPKILLASRLPQCRLEADDLVLGIAFDSMISWAVGSLYAGPISDTAGRISFRLKTRDGGFSVVMNVKGFGQSLEKDAQQICTADGSTDLIRLILENRLEPVGPLLDLVAAKLLAEEALPDFDVAMSLSSNALTLKFTRKKETPR